MNFAKFIKTTFLKNKFAWLLRLYNEPEHDVLMISIFFAANTEGTSGRFRLIIFSVCHYRFQTEHGDSRKINDNFCKEKSTQQTKTGFYYIPTFPPGIYLFRFNKGNTRAMFEICLTLTVNRQNNINEVVLVS